MAVDIYRTIKNKLQMLGFSVSTIEISDPVESSGFIETANDSDFIYFVGGGIIERWAPDIIRNFDQYFRKIRKPYGVIGLSCGEFIGNYLAMSDSLRLFCDNASFFYTRDLESVQVFKLCGASKLPTPSVDVVLSNDFDIGYQPQKTCLTANFRNVPYADLTDDLEWHDWSASLKKARVDHLIADCSAAHQQLDLPVSARPVLHDIMGSHIVIGMRFHIILVAAMLNIPVVPICYCPKVLRLAHQLGLEDYTLGIHESGRLESVLGSLTNNYAAVKLTLRKRVAVLGLMAKQTVNASIVSMLNSVPARD